MKYSLAKQLKEAGFPQFYASFMLDYGDRKGQRIFYDNEWVYTPTLSELIEACGEDFGELQREKDEAGEVIWYATHRVMNDMTGGYARGKAPSEAVAKLYIKIYD